MEKLLNFLGKAFPKSYDKIKKNKKLTDFLAYISLLLFVFRRKKSFFRFFIKTTFSYYILKNKSDVTFEFEGNKIIMPRHLRGIDGFIEVWSDGFYDKIKGYNHVLDLGGYVGDSALYFAKNNKKVTVYEAHPGNFEYLEKNIKNFKNVISYNQAVVGDSNVNFIKFYGGSFNMSAGDGHIFKNENYIKVPAMSILTILKNNNFDALKMDIEGAEYDCFDAIINSKEDNFQFAEGFVEFHLSENKKADLIKINDILIWLRENKKYKISYYDAVSNKPLESTQKIETNVILIHFCK